MARAGGGARCHAASAIRGTPYRALDDRRDPDTVEHSPRDGLHLARARGQDGVALVAVGRAGDVRGRLAPADGMPCADTLRRVFEVLDPQRRRALSSPAGCACSSAR